MPAPTTRGRQISDVHLYDTIANTAFDIGTSASGFPDVTGGLIQIYGDDDNEAPVYLGDSTVTVGNGFPILASGVGYTGPLLFDNLNRIYGISSVANQKLRILIMRETD